MSEPKVREADKLEVTILVDNYTDLLMLQSTEVVKRLRVPPPKAPVAEHGLSCLLKVYADSEEHVVLMDAGISARYRHTNDQAPHQICSRWRS